MLFNLDFANNTILIPIAIAQIFNPLALLVIPIEIPSREAKVDTEIYPVIAEGKIKCSMQFSVLQTFYAY